ncbi:MAG TPA: cytochrome c oxidase assembly protein [Acidimicrobiales bacterium]|nr:cytochrome c oxidase assembly protein [Acidimicrobiales bacterium]
MLLADAVSPPVSVHTLLTGWQTDPLSLLTLVVEVALAAWYVVSVRRLAARGRAWSTARIVCFLAGTALLVVAVQSGLAAYDDQVFWVHVVQHLLLMNFAPILLALSAPVTLALQASSRRTQRVLLGILHHPVVEVVTHPVVVVVAAYGTMLVYFLSPFYNFSLEHPWVHDLTHLHFLVSGCLFWWLVVGRDPTRWRLSFPAKIGFLAAGIPINAVLGVSLTGATASIAPHFHTLGDTHVGGSVLWVVGELTSLIALGIVLYQWMQYEERAAVRADRRSDAAAVASSAAPATNGRTGGAPDR